jgi:hypothetical protein
MAAGQFNAMPQYPEPLGQGGNTSMNWYRFWAGLFRGLPPENVTDVGLTGSPYVYSAARRGSLIVNGGTVSNISFSRDGGTTYYTVGTTAGMFLLNAADLLKITYAAPPTVTFVPT